MRYEVVKLDKRYANYGSFRYMLEFSKSTWRGTGVLEFDRARRWMNKTWGWTQDVTTRSALIQRLADPMNNSVKEEDINRHWAYSVEYKEYRVYLKGDKELAFFQLVHAQSND